MRKTSQTILLSAILLTAVVAVIPALPVRAQPTAMIFVSPTGSDAVGSGSAASPYQTISHAVSEAPTGAKVVVLPGTYNEMVNFSKQIYLVSASGQASNTIINAAGLAHGIELLGNSASGTAIEGFTVENANEQGIYVQDANNVVITNNQALNNAQNAAIVCPFAPPLTVPKCILEDKGIELIGTAGATVAGNSVIGTVGDGGIGVSDDGALNPGVPCALNLTSGACPGGIPGAANPAKDNVVVGNRVVANVGGCGIVVSAYDPGSGVIGNVVLDNDIVANAEGIVVATPVPGTSAINNTVAGNSVSNSATEGIDIDFSTGAFAPGGVFSGNSVINNIVTNNGPDYDFRNPQSTGIAVISPNSNLVRGTMVVGNIIRNEYYGIGVFNSTGTILQSNSMDPSVTAPITGATQTPGVRSDVIELQASLASLQGSLTTLQNSISQLRSTSATDSSLNALSSTVSTLQSNLSLLQGSVASQSSLNSVSTVADNATNLAYVAIAVAVVFGAIAIVLSRRGPSSKQTQ